jgi:hypothetical protein
VVQLFKQYTIIYQHLIVSEAVLLLNNSGVLPQNLPNEVYDRKFEVLLLSSEGLLKRGMVNKKSRH